MLSDNQIETLENQISDERKTVDFDTREFTIEFLVKKYIEGLEKDENDIFVPDYQREFVWDDTRQSKLIESLILGLPIPIIFLAENERGRLEIVDGSQRIRTLAAFVQDELTIVDLDKLTCLNGLKYSDLPPSRQRKINNTPIRMIVLSESASDSVKNDLFERINRGSDLLRNMEKRKGIYRGKFNTFIYQECAQNADLIRITPLANSVKNRQEREELVLRFFALTDQYPNFKTHRNGIGAALDEYFEEGNANFNESNLREKGARFQRMVDFVARTFPCGFSKRTGQAVSRVYFEAISVGVHLALQRYPDLRCKPIQPDDLLSDPGFYASISGKYKTHTPTTIKSRIDFVCNKIISNKIQ